MESISAVNDIEHLLADKDIDGVMVGPYDISGSLKVPGQLAHPKVLEACQKVLKACRRYGKSAGTQIIEPDEKNVKKAFGNSCTFVVLASDVFLLWKWSDRMKKLIGQL